MPDGDWTMGDIEAYLALLDGDTRRLYGVADDLEHMHGHDTLSDDYQIAAEVVEVFWKYMRRRFGEGN